MLLPSQNTPASYSEFLCKVPIRDFSLAYASNLLKPECHPSKYRSLCQAVQQPINVMVLGMRRRLKILSDDAEFQGFSNPPSQAGVQPQIAGRGAAATIR